MKRLIAPVVLIGFMMMPAVLAMAGKKAGVIEYTEHRLNNGLRVILSEDHSVPIVTVDVWYHVGSAYEDEGRSGFAHLFEHMMFQGSDNVGKAEHMKYVARAGGNTNGSTTEDRTNYFEVLPANQLSLGLWLEADRMRSLKVTTENFENQRETVKEERRLRVDNQPYGAAFLTADTLSYDFRPYSHTVIGKMQDLDNAEVGDVQAFFDKYYSPNNAVLVLVGDFDKKKAIKLVEKYFGDIPRGASVTPLSGSEPEHDAERRMTIDDPNANVPAVFMTYTVPSHQHPDTPALELLGKILTDGESSRMYKRLVKEEEAAVIVFGGVDSRMGPGLFRFISAANVGVDIADCERLMLEEIAKLQNGGISESELEKAKVQFKSDVIRGRQTVLRKAEELQHYAYFHDDLSEINSDLDRFMAVTAKDIVRVAKQYFVSNNRTVVIANPAKSSS